MIAHCQADENFNRADKQVTFRAPTVSVLHNVENLASRAPALRSKNRTGGLHPGLFNEWKDTWRTVRSKSKPKT